MVYIDDFYGYAQASDLCGDRADGEFLEGGGAGFRDAAHGFAADRAIGGVSRGEAVGTADSRGKAHAGRGSAAAVCGADSRADRGGGGIRPCGGGSSGPHTASRSGAYARHLSSAGAIARISGEFS